MPHLASLMANVGHPRVLVLGDMILDRYIWGNADRVSPEAPVLVLKSDEQEIRPGGAASVAALLRGLEAEVMPVGVIGDDVAGRQLTKLLDELDINSTSLARDPQRPTTTKERFIGRAAGRHAHQILRVDAESTSSISPHLEEELLQSVIGQLHRCDVLLISDYAKGVCTPRLLAEVIKAAAQRQVPVIIDPARIAEYSRYTGADILTPNRIEAELASGRSITTPESALIVAHLLSERHHIGSVLVTLDRDGIALSTTDRQGQHFPTRPRSVYDITGAGDMVLAVIGLCRAANIPLADAARLANIAAGLEVERLGVAAVTRKDMQAELAEADPRKSRSDRKLVTLDELTALAARYRQESKSLVFTNGCFDLLHIGHVRCLEEAAQLGDVLIAAVNCDAVVAKLKGSGRPVISEQDRAAMVAALSSVDHVILFADETPHRLLRQLRPDVLVKGGTTAELIGNEIVRSYGGHIATTRVVNGVSTTMLLASLRSAQAHPPSKFLVPTSTLQDTPNLHS